MPLPIPSVISISRDTWWFYSKFFIIRIVSLTNCCCLSCSWRASFSLSILTRISLSIYCRSYSSCSALILSYLLFSFLSMISFSPLRTANRAYSTYQASLSLIHSSSCWLYLCSSNSLSIYLYRLILVALETNSRLYSDYGDGTRSYSTFGGL